MTPVQPNSWVTVPFIGQIRVPLYCDGMLPSWYCWATRPEILLDRADRAAAVAARAFARLCRLRASFW